MLAYAIGRMGYRKTYNDRRQVVRYEKGQFAHVWNILQPVIVH